MIMSAWVRCCHTQCAVYLRENIQPLCHGHRGSKEQRSHSGIQSVPDFRMTSGLAAMLKESLQSIICWS